MTVATKEEKAAREFPDAPSAITGRGRSRKQDAGTPSIYIAAVERTFGPIRHDLAASKKNHVTEARKNYYTPADDALDVETPWPSWRKKKQLPVSPENPHLEWSFLNPPFSNIYPWASRSAYEMEENRVDTLLHVPASVDSAWWNEWVNGKAWWVSLKGRLTYKGEKQGYPRPLVQIIYSDLWKPHDGLRELGFSMYEDGSIPWPTQPGYLGQWDFLKVVRMLDGGKK